MKTEHKFSFNLCRFLRFGYEKKKKMMNAVNAIETGKGKQKK